MREVTVTVTISETTWAWLVNRAGCRTPEEHAADVLLAAHVLHECRRKPVIIYG
ncbi:hypothetical protein JRG19_02445 [Pseudoclavibacter alba]|uniref:hypothetical protein n=1 Tax=Pseudoclavibacter albus TaxID=272241 RepID=UPI0019CFF76D|nr:hypothetical protein [Pseudoclavibacter alba]MBN6777410.1 hypothetical protein [Pseudoclavibacter alba]